VSLGLVGDSVVGEGGFVASDCESEKEGKGGRRGQRMLDEHVDGWDMGLALVGGELLSVGHVD
jgi:hypothetical protein